VCRNQEREYKQEILPTILTCYTMQILLLARVLCNSPTSFVYT
jgi:hypothetical protein